MKRFLFGFLAVLFLILNTIPYLHILADDMPTNSQYEMLGAYALSTLITSGEATELDFSDYTENDTSFLIDLGEAIFTGDWSGLAEDGLEWLGETADSIYDSYKEYVSQWKSEHLGLMYSNWFPDEQIYVGPDDSYSLAKPLRELLTPRGSEPIVPSPPIDYTFYTNKLSSFYGFYNSGTSQDDYYYLSNITRVDSGWSAPSFDLVPCSVVCFSGSLNGSNTANNVFYTSTITINIANTGNNNYSLTCSGGSSNTSFSYNGSRYNSFYQVYPVTGSNGYLRANTVLNQNLDLSSLNTSYSSLIECLSYCITHFRYVNLYVDNVPWVLVGSNEPTYPIVIPGQLTIYNNQPLEYTFPLDTHIDLPDLTTIIRNAINSSGLVMWSDIADVFVDVNGQTAVAITKIVRNDYDNLYMEQYPYPAMLVGMTDQTKFNEHLLDNSHAYLSPMGTIVQETVNVLPSELVGVLAIGAILTIFAVIINRLLE